MTDEMRVERGAEELEDRSALGFTGTDGRPNAFAPALAFVAACALGDAPVDNEVADCLLGHVVGWLDSWGGDEGEELLWVKAEALAQVTDARSVRGVLETVDQPVA
jgi:hypothetical protein